MFNVRIESCDHDGNLLIKVETRRGSRWCSSSDAAATLTYAFLQGQLSFRRDIFREIMLLDTLDLFRLRFGLYNDSQSGI